MTQQRRQGEAEYAAERASLAEAQRLAAQEERSYQGDQTYYPAYPGYPLYPIPLPCKRGNCAGRHPRVGMNVPGHIPGRPVRPVRAPLLDPPTAILTNPPAPRSHR